MRARAFLLAAFFCLVLPPYAALAAPAPTVTNDRATLNFPESLTFHAEMQSEAVINVIVLEYGAEQLTCGTVVAKAFPQFTPAKTVTAEWTWEMKQSGSLPPGAVIWWRWHYTDEAGQTTSTDAQHVIWLDNQHDWQTISSGNINLHWYNGDRAFGGELYDAAAQGLDRLGQDAGMKPEKPVDLYIYTNTQDMQDAILYEPGWTGGMAFPQYDIVIIGIAPTEIDWGKRTEVHELTHVLVGHLTFSCLGDVPTWLNEGLAVYSEGELEAYSQTQLEAAIRDNTLFSLRSLSGGFSEIPDKADLSYSQSYSVVRFLIEKYGRDKMTALLLALRDGETVDDALTTVYGFDVDGLEDAWRAAIGAQARLAVPNPTATPTPTIVPTIVPISGAPGAAISTPAALPATPTLSAQAPAATSGTPAQPAPVLPLPVDFALPSTYAIVIVAGCALLGFGLIAMSIFFAMRGKRRKK